MQITHAPKTEGFVTIDLTLEEAAKFRDELDNLLANCGYRSANTILNRVCANLPKI